MRTEKNDDGRVYIFRDPAEYVSDAMSSLNTGLIFSSQGRMPGQRPKIGENGQSYHPYDGTKVIFIADDYFANGTISNGQLEWDGKVFEFNENIRPEDFISLAKNGRPAALVPLTGELEDMIKSLKYDLLQEGTVTQKDFVGYNMYSGNVPK